jgi:hypothetical protein
MALARYFFQNKLLSPFLGDVPSVGSTSKSEDNITNANNF